MAGSRVAALVSGGLDSCILLAELASRATDVFPVYVRSGLRWEEAEIHSLRRILQTQPFERCQALSILELPIADVYDDHWSVRGSSNQVPGHDADLASNYLPGRNLLLLAKAAVFCALKGIDRLAMAPLADNPFPDGTPEFFAMFTQLASRCLNVRLNVEIPFRTLAKGDVIRRGMHVPLDLTFSCIRPVGLEHCGECTKCAERQSAFREAGVDDPTAYAKRPR